MSLFCPSAGAAYGIVMTDRTERARKQAGRMQQPQEIAELDARIEPPCLLRFRGWPLSTGSRSTWGWMATHAPS
jgi:hypothetical protein